MKIRLAETKDFDQILIINQAGQPGVWPLTASELGIILVNAPYFYVVEVREEVAGYIIGYLPSSLYYGEEFSWFKQRYSHFLYIDQIAIAPWSQRAKIGTTLYAHAETFARQEGFTTLLAEVNLEPPNRVSIWFHQELGFREVGTLDLVDGRRVAFVEKSLAPKEFESVTG